jgi:heme oxygenase
MTALDQLRAETRAIHDSLDKISGADLIMNHTVTHKQYQQILANNYCCYKTTQDALRPYAYNFNFAKKILADLNSETIKCEEKSLFLESKYEALGAAYVLSGSQLGATIIGKAVKESPSLSHLPQQQFYSRPSKTDQQFWKNHLKKLKDESLSADQIQEIISGAVKTFDLFKSTFESNPVNRD